MAANEKEANHHILCSYDIKFELFHSVQKHTPFWSIELNVAQINYFIWEMPALKKLFFQMEEVQNMHMRVTLKSRKQHFLLIFQSLRNEWQRCIQLW